jgi:Ca2+-dependent lipid-binding protein
LLSSLLQEYILWCDLSYREYTGKEMEGKKVAALPARPQTNPIVSFAKKVGLRTLAWVGVYLLGYFDFSIAWMVTPLLLSVLRDQWKKEKRKKLTAAREAALTNEQAMIEARMDADELPSWVFFPDKERAEWINSILKQLWPYVNEYVRDTLFNTVEPAVETALRQYKLNGFRFERERVFLGQVPPRVTGIKVYDSNTSRREIILDMDICFASDMEIVFKVKGISARVSDFGLRGMARVVLKPLISQIPLVGGVQVYFLKVPEIDYTLGGVAGALEIPGLNKIVEKIIAEQIKNFIVLPNKFSMPLVTSIPNKVLKCPDSAGVLRVKLIKARGLKDTDGIGSGKSDPYCILTVGAHTSRAPTKLDSLNPEWNMSFDFPIEIVQGQELLLELYDEDSRKGDQFLGRAKIQSNLVADRGHIESYWVDLMDTEGKGEEGEQANLGQVQVSLSWLPVTPDSVVVKAAAKTVKPGAESAACLVHLYIDSCSGLTNPKDPAYKPSPKVEIVNGNRTVQRTWPKYFTNDPVIEQGFVALIHNPYTDEIRLNVVDTASKKDDVIGTTVIRIWSLIEQPEMEYSLQVLNIRYPTVASIIPALPAEGEQS